MGNNETIRGSGLYVVGNNNTVYGEKNSIIGNNNDIKGDDNVITGNNNDAKGNRNRITGNNNTANGDDNTLTGRNNNNNNSTTRFIGGIGGISFTNGGSLTVSNSSFVCVRGDDDINIDGIFGNVVVANRNDSFGSNKKTKSDDDVAQRCVAVPTEEQQRLHDKPLSDADDADDADACIVCMANKRNCDMVPCGHNCVCCACAIKLGKNGTALENSIMCPKCRKPVTQIMYVYK